jgi:hypothetical protein
MRRTLLLLVLSVALLLEFRQPEAPELAATKTTVSRRAVSPQRTPPHASEESQPTRYTPKVTAEIAPSVLIIDVNDDVKAADTLLLARPS